MLKKHILIIVSCLLLINACNFANATTEKYTAVPDKTISATATGTPENTPVEPTRSAPTKTVAPSTLLQDTGPVDTIVEKWLTQNQVSSATVSLIKSGEIVLTKGYGLADREKNISASENTVYMLASLSKPVLALAALKLVEQGKLDLDTDINQYLGFNLRNPNFTDKAITMRDLLHHTSSLVDASTDEIEDYPRPDPSLSLEETIRGALLLDGEDYQKGAYWSRSYAPGKVFEYANIGAALAGLLIEKASGMEFSAYTNQVLFAPLDMPHTRWFYSQLPADTQLALPYDADFKSYGIYSFNDYPSGSLRTNASEMAHLLQMLIQRGKWQGSQMLSDASIAEFERPQFHTDDNEQIGLFIFISKAADGSTEYWHSGGEYGVSTEFYYNSNGTGAVVLTNGDEADTETLLNSLIGFLRKK